MWWCAGGTGEGRGKGGGGGGGDGSLPFCATPGKRCGDAHSVHVLREQFGAMCAATVTMVTIHEEEQPPSTRIPNTVPNTVVYDKDWLGRGGLLGDDHPGRGEKHAGCSHWLSVNPVTNYQVTTALCCAAWSRCGLAGATWDSTPRRTAGTGARPLGSARSRRCSCTRRRRPCWGDAVAANFTTEPA